jgi:hypothetical protein
MFGAGAAPQRRMVGGGSMPMDKAPDGLPYGPSAGGSPVDRPSVLGQGSIAPPIDGFALGRDMANLSQVDPIKTKPYKGLFPGKDWITIAGILSDAIAGGFGGQPQFGPMMMRQREAEAEHNRNLDMWRQKVALEREERMRPRVEQVGSSVGILNPDPTNPSFKPVYQVPGAAEQYAVARGFAPGTPEYASAVQEYRLGSWSDPAVEAKAELEGIRYGYRDELQDERLATSRRNTDVRANVTRRGQNMTDTRVRRGQDVTDKRVRESAGFKAHPKAKASGLVGAVHKDATGRSIQYSSRRNAWIDLSTGEPVK